MHRLRIAVFAGLVLTGASIGAAAKSEKKPCEPERWQDAMQAFEKQDNESPSPEGGLVFVGSSSIRLWDLKKWFPDARAVNRGFGGSQICDSTHYAETLVLKHRPRVVVFYAGDNDIAAGKKAEQVHSDFREFVAKVRDALPQTAILYISIKPSTSRWKLADEMKKANELIKAECEKEKSLTFIDVWPKMLGSDGKPRKELLREDGLHLTDEGYKVWTHLVAQELDLRVGR